MRMLTSLTGVLLLLGLAACSSQPAETVNQLSLEYLRGLNSSIRTASGADPDLELQFDWKGNTCRIRLLNTTSRPVNVREVVLFSGAHNLKPETRLYGEGFQMLSQTGGTIGFPEDLSVYTDRDHYRIPHQPNTTTVYGLLMLSPPNEDRVLMGFTSCRRFDSAESSASMQ